MLKNLNLAFGLCFSDLYENAGLLKLDGHFLAFLSTNDPLLHQRLVAARQNPPEAMAESQLLLDLAPSLEVFIGQLFAITSEILCLQEAQHNLAPLFTIKRSFVQRHALKKYPEAQSFDGAALAKTLGELLGNAAWDELDFAKAITAWLRDEAAHEHALTVAARYAAWACHQGWRQSVLFHVPQKLTPATLVETIQKQQGDVTVQIGAHLRHRNGFACTDPGLTRAQSLDQANYCIWCHHQSKDSCSKGLHPKDTAATEQFQRNAWDKPLIGCPLEQKISEMNETKAQGFTLGALAIIIIDNPLVAATGNRICNDCMKACIFQKQEPVNIPGIETQILMDVLNLPWGFEIYSLLTRWNPLNFRAFLPLPLSPYKVLVVGMGPAGFTLAHYLLQQGHSVVGIDGLKIEPLDPALFQPILNVSDISEPLDTRVNEGFGGVAEYGITVRWDKNFLKIIRLLLERRKHFLLFGGVRYGGTLTTEQALSLGFDHIALCMGAGSPTRIPLKNGLAKGVRQASDFLMALQLTGAAKRSSLANLGLRLPVVVIGGGLTAIDTATEALAYYPQQVEKFYHRYQTLVAEQGQAVVEAGWTSEDREIAAEMLEHAAALLATDKESQRHELLHSWGGVTVVYRRKLIESPSYILNHEEVAKALEEGIAFLEDAVPQEVITNAYNSAVGLQVRIQKQETTLPARTILIAAGTQPNTNLQYDEPVIFQALDDDGKSAQPERLAKPKETYVLINSNQSFFGDLHPSFAGNVVKAMASAKKGHPVIERALRKSPPSAVTPLTLFAALNTGLRPTVERVTRLTPTIVEVVVRAPFAAQAFQPGQFYRLQNYERYAKSNQDTRLAMEGIALTGAAAYTTEGLVSLIVLEMGGSSRLCATLQPGDPVVLMGPTGTPTEIPSNEAVLLMGGGLGNAVLFSIGAALRQKGNKVIYCAAYKNMSDRYKVAEIEAAADKIVWCCEEAPGFTPERPGDVSFQGNIIAALRAYAETFDLKTIDRVLAIGSDRMMAAVAEVRSFFRDDVRALASINAPMQCMMKGICAQCLQKHRDPLTGEETVVYSCVNQDQDLTTVDFASLNQRLQQNHVHELLTNLWVQRII
ncbi:MAG: FAD-dependent oxidoreductase [Alphaproteobacteria bacterium]